MTDLDAKLTALQAMDLAALRREWCRYHRAPPPRLSRDLLLRDLAYTLQEDAYGGVSKAIRRRLRTLAKAVAETGRVAPENRLGQRINQLGGCACGQEPLRYSVMATSTFRRSAT